MLKLNQWLQIFLWLFWMPDSLLPVKAQTAQLFRLWLKASKIDAQLYVLQGTEP